MRRNIMLPDGLFKVWRRLGITFKFGLFFASLLVLCIVSAFVSLTALHVVQKAEADILTISEIRQKVFEMDGEMEKARRLYWDFLLYSPEVGYAKAQEQYGQPALAVAAHVIAVNEDLKRLITESNVGEELRKRNVDINLYLSISKRFSTVLLDNMQLRISLADPTDGLEERLEQTLAVLKEYLSKQSSFIFILQDSYLHVLQYKLSRQRPYMQSALNSINKLKTKVTTATELTTVEKTAVCKQLDAYTLLSEKILETDVAIRGSNNDFALQAKTVAPISQELKALSVAEVGRARSHVDGIIRAAEIVITLSALLGVGCAAVVAFLINSSITKKIVAMTHSASELRAGNLDVTVKSDSCDELGVLADTFNSMAHQVKFLIENLEENVRQRTRELALINNELDEKNKTLEILSMTDRLTGLCNRRKIDETLRTELRRIKRYHNPFSLLMIDVDHFKSVNDNHGHQLGDEVLVKIADILRGLARETDIVGRWGGEEFLVICPETGPEVALFLAQRLRKEIENTEFPIAGRLTASFGLTTSAPGDDVHALMLRADSALYKAKQNGRNRVETA